ncbi:hypothetical protein PMZ80_007655 [Knufia obscura]|uniref:ubiquitinyl hydrolase 1 n=1 Tax=Knufia obscura TaxID=1635080 RepID=A0ABR0RIX8_9EURO|nr:hypothetical protein PMZ80_007655 [Knufia obscura]
MHKCKRDMRFQHPPPMLVIMLRRAVQTKKYNGKDAKGKDTYFLNACKDMSAVKVCETLDVSRWLNPHEFGRGSKIQYRLAAITCHSGKDPVRGHHKSFVRGGKNRDKWYEVNDENVTERALSYFDDSNPDKHTFRTRSTPYLLFFDRDFSSEKVVPGRPHNNLAMNVRPVGSRAGHSPVSTAANVKASAVSQGASKPAAQTREVTTPSTPAETPQDGFGPGVQQAENGQALTVASLTSKTGAGMDPDNRSEAIETHQAVAQIAAAGDTSGGQPSLQEQQALPDKEQNQMQGVSANMNENQAANNDGPATKDDQQAGQSVDRQASDKGVQTNDQDHKKHDGTNDKRTLIHVDTFDGDEDWPAAELDTAIRIGDTWFQMPKHVIKCFDRRTPREVEIKATLKVPIGTAGNGIEPMKRKAVHIDLAEAYVDAEVERRKKPKTLEDGEAQLTAPPGWTGRWSGARRSNRLAEKRKRKHVG